MAYNETLAQLGDETAGAVMALYRQLIDGNVSRETFHAQLEIIVNRQQQQAGVLAALSMAGWRIRNTGEYRAELPAGTMGPETTAARDRLRESLTVPASATAGYAVERAARGVAVASAQEQFTELLHSADDVAGWQRKLNAGACPLCEGLQAGGETFGKKHKFVTHKGCTCSQVPIAKERV